MTNGDASSSSLIATPWYKSYAWLIYPIAILGIILRAPDRLLYPQLWAEDGRIFLRESVHAGFGSLFDDYAGYLHLLLRIVAYPGRWLPLECIPTFYYSGAIALVLLGIWLIQHSRHDLPAKPLMALCVPFVMFPGATMLNLTNAQRFLAPALAFLLLQQPALTRRHTIQDAIATLCLGLTGPFSLLWLPLLALRPFLYSFRRSDLAIYLPAIVSAAIQLALVLNYTPPEVPGDPQVAPSFVELIRATAVYSNAYFYFGPLASHYPIPLAIIGACISAWWLWLVLHLPLQPRLIALGLLAAGIIILLAGAARTTSQAIATMWPGHAGERYYLPLFMFATQVLVLLAYHTSHTANRIAFRAVILLVALTTISTFRIIALPDLHWKKEVHEATNIPGQSRLEILPNPEWHLHAYPPSPKPDRPLLAKDYVIKRVKPPGTNTDTSPPAKPPSSR